jgi:hypothetical protein
VEAESEASIWSLKGSRNLTMLRIRVKVDVQEGRTSSGIKVGIMGTWLEMRHFALLQFSRSRDFVMEDLPGDMQNMRKLQSFKCGVPWVKSAGLHLQVSTSSIHIIVDCPHLRELSPLERLPNLKCLKLDALCSNLKELGIGNSGRAIGFLMLEKLVIEDLPKLESIAGPSNNGVWNETILPNLCVLAIQGVSMFE